MAEDFKAAAQIKHDGSRGAVRESVLRSFLHERLPRKLAIGSGEIVSAARETSAQVDLVIYDALETVPLLFSDAVQVFPIEGVYGTIEVKSGLDKPELIKGLDNIESVKSIAPRGVFQHRVGAMVSGMPRPAPFGTVFGYSLRGNSLHSLVQNLVDWEADHDPQVWPNLVVVLGEGLIYHTDKKHRACIHNETITGDTKPTAIEHGIDSLFHFYSAVLDLASAMQLGPLSLMDYYEMPERVGNHLVANHDRLTKRDSTGKVMDAVFRLKPDFLCTVIEWSMANGKMTGSEAYRYVFGDLPSGFDERDFRGPTYVYNPDGLPSGAAANAELAIARNEGRKPSRTVLPVLGLTVDGDVLFLPFAYVRDHVVEPIPGKTLQDL